MEGKQGPGVAWQGTTCREEAACPCHQVSMLRELREDPTRRKCMAMRGPRDDETVSLSVGAHSRDSFESHFPFHVGTRVMPGTVCGDKQSASSKSPHLLLFPLF